RTGMTEIAATCTLGLADVVVMLSGLNDQNLQGTRWVLDMLESEGGLRSEDIIVVFSPIPEAEEELKTERLQRAREIVGNRHVLLLPYHPRLALVEELFVKEWKETSLSQKYHQLASKISRRNPDDIETIIEEGKRLYQDAKIDEAKETFDRALQIDSTDEDAKFYASATAHIDAESYYDLGIALSNLGERRDDESLFEEAIQKYRKAIEINPNNATAYNNLGIALSNLGERRDDESLFEEAIQKYQKAIEIDPNNAEAYNNLGIARSDLAKRRRDKSLLEEAIQSFQKMIEIKPDFAESYYSLGIALSNLAERRDDESLFEEAIQSFQKVIEIKPDFAESYYSLGIALSNLAERRDDESLLEEAIQKYQKAIEINPDDAKAYYNLGIALSNLGERRSDEFLLEEAGRYYQKSEELEYERRSQEFRT
nr:tetratricopeptide repeat protein [bacterium]